MTCKEKKKPENKDFLLKENSSIRGHGLLSSYR